MQYNIGIFSIHPFCFIAPQRSKDPSKGQNLKGLTSDSSPKLECHVACFLPYIDGTASPIQRAVVLISPIATVITYVFAFLSNHANTLNFF